MFGKKFARICDYLYCYFLIGFLFGFILVGIGMPLLILTNCFLSILLVLTAWLWIPACLLLRLTFHILIWDFDSPTRFNWRDYSPRYLSYQTLEQFPIFVLYYEVFIGLVEITLSIIAATIFHPFIAIFMTFWAIFRIIISTLTDFIMYYIVKAIGR